MAEMEKVASAASKRSDRAPSLNRVYSAPHIDNHAAFYGSSKEEDGQETDSVVPSYTTKAEDNRDLESGDGSVGPDQDDALQHARTARSQRSERDPKLVSIVAHLSPNLHRPKISFF